MSAVLIKQPMCQEAAVAAGPGPFKPDTAFGMGSDRVYRALSSTGLPRATLYVSQAQWKGRKFYFIRQGALSA